MWFKPLLVALILQRSIRCESHPEEPTSSNSSDHHLEEGHAGPVIHAQLAFVSLLEVSEKRSEIVFSCFLKASWTAGRAHSGHEDPFTPRLIPAGARRVDNAGHLTPVLTVHRSGQRYHQVALVTVVQPCDFDYTHFPFDTQNCLIRISPTESDATLASSNASDIQVEPDFNSFQHEFVARVQPTANRAPVGAAAGADHLLSALAVRVRLRRRLGPQVVRLFAPSTLLVMASWLAALIPASLIRSRLPITILSLLTLLLACDTARSGEPASSGPGTAANLWETGCLLFSLVSVLEAVLDMHLLVRAVTRGDPRAERLERRGACIYFWAYALCWVIFCLAYWRAYVPRWRSSLDENE